MREYRQLSDITQAKISQSMKGRTKTTTHRENISNGLKTYWQTIPNKPINDTANE